MRYFTKFCVNRISVLSFPCDLYEIIHLATKLTLLSRNNVNRTSVLSFPRDLYEIIHFATKLTLFPLNKMRDLFTQIPFGAYKQNFFLLFSRLLSEKIQVSFHIWIISIFYTLACFSGIYFFCLFATEQTRERFEYIQ